MLSFQLIALHYAILHYVNIDLSILVYLRIVYAVSLPLLSLKMVRTSTFAYYTLQYMLYNTFM